MLRFIGQQGECLPGVPARDITDEEEALYPEAAESPLYLKVIKGGGKPAGRKSER